eukprot:2712037-Rhodomonas_salina.4
MVPGHGSGDFGARADQLRQAGQATLRRCAAKSNASNHDLHGIRTRTMVLLHLIRHCACCTKSGFDIADRAVLSGSERAMRCPPSDHALERGKPRKKSIKVTEEVTTHQLLPSKTFWVHLSTRPTVKKEGLKLKKGKAVVFRGALSAVRSTELADGTVWCRSVMCGTECVGWANRRERCDHRQLPSAQANPALVPRLRQR